LMYMGENMFRAVCLNERKLEAACGGRRATLTAKKRARKSDWILVDDKNGLVTTKKQASGGIEAA